MTPESDDRAPETPAANPYARSRVDGGCTVVEAAGEIDLATAGFLAEHLDAATASDRPDVLVDLRQVEFFGCSGLRGRLRVVTDGPAPAPAAAGLRRSFPALPEFPESLEPPEKE
jgi:anti-sigma B factor antagonist